MSEELWVGIGCTRGTSARLIGLAVRQVCQAYQLDEGAIVGVATIDRKIDELGLVEFCRSRHLPLVSFSAEQLAGVAVKTGSAIVQREVGCASVAEAAALWAAKLAAGRRRDRPNASQLRVPKTIVRSNGDIGIVTVAMSGVISQGISTREGHGSP